MSRFGDIRSPARRENWGTAVEVDDGLYRIRLDNPVGLLLVNSYAYKSQSDLVVIDPGWPWTLDALEQALRDLGLARSLADVTAWLYTHSHIDHMGGAALLSELSTAAHYVMEDLEPFLQEWHTFQNRTNDWTPWADEAFDDEETPRVIRESAARRRAAGVEFLLEAHGERAVEQPVFLEFGERFRVADLQLDFLDARGHDPFHGAFFEPSRGWLFGGDVVIATPTPISRPMDDDLDLYLGSLERLAALDTKLLLPGHGVQRGGDLSPMFERSRAYQDDLRSAVLTVLEQSDEPLGLVALALRTTSDGQPYRPWGRWIVHLALIDTHLQKLVAQGLAERLQGPKYCGA